MCQGNRCILWHTQPALWYYCLPFSNYYCRWKYRIHRFELIPTPKVQCFPFHKTKEIISKFKTTALVWELNFLSFSLKSNTYHYNNKPWSFVRNHSVSSLFLNVDISNFLEGKLEPILACNCRSNRWYTPYEMANIKKKDENASSPAVKKYHNDNDNECNPRFIHIHYLILIHGCWF